MKKTIYNLFKLFKKNKDTIFTFITILISISVIMSQFIVFIINKGFYDYFYVDISLYSGFSAVEFSTLIFNTIIFIFFTSQIIFLNLIIEMYGKTSLGKSKNERILIYIMILIGTLAIYFGINTIAYSTGIYNFTGILKNNDGTNISPLLMTFYQFFLASFYKLIGIIDKLLPSNNKNIKINKDVNVNEANVDIKSTNIYIMIFTNVFKIFATMLLIFVVISFLYSSGRTSAEKKREFYIIDNKYAIIKINNNSAVVLDCIYDNNDLTINSYIQKKIDIDDIELIRIKVNKLIINK